MILNNEIFKRSKKQNLQNNFLCWTCYISQVDKKIDDILAQYFSFILYYRIENM